MTKVIIDDPIIAAHPTRKNNWIVMKDFHFNRYAIDIVIPRGFVTDLASIPRFLWWVIAPFELSITAPIVHDWCYRKALCSKGAADQIFHWNMIDEKVAVWRRNIAYYGVKWFGDSSFGTSGTLIEEVEEI